MSESRVAAVDSPAVIHGDMLGRVRSGPRVRLTEVELDILVALADGLQSKEIACALGRSVASIEAYIRVLCGKLDARTRAHLVAQAFRAGVLRAEPAELD